MTYIQQLRSKHIIPTPTGGPPPRYPRNATAHTTDWQVHADKFAAYALTLFKPWGQHQPLDMSWDSFITWAATLQRPEASYVDRCTFTLLRNLVNNFTSSSHARWVTSQWRNRATTRWTEEERLEALKYNKQGLELEETTENDQLALQAFINFLREQHNTDSPAGTAKDKQQQFNQLLLSTLETIFEKPTTETGMGLNGDQPVVCRFDDIVRVKEVATAVGEPLCNREPLNTLSEVGVVEHQSTMQAPPNLQPDSSLNKEQNTLLVEVLTWLSLRAKQTDESNYPQALKIIIHGGPGTGKSFFANTLLRRAKEIPGCGRIVCAAPTGIAATLLPGGRTLHSLLHIPVEGKKKQGKLTAAAFQTTKNALDQVCLLIIDEMSMIDGHLFNAIDQRLRELGVKDQPFGGLGVLLMGDFFQLPCIGKRLYDESLNRHSAAGDLFKCFKVITFTQQMRAMSDPIHSRMIDTLRDVSSTGFTTEMLQQLPVLSKEVLRKDPSWKFAPIVVTNNSERLALNAMQIQHFAHSRGIPVVRWRFTLHEQAATWFAKEQDCKRLYMSTPELWGWFAAGAPVFLTENINPDKGLANGTMGHIVSLTVSSEEVDHFWAEYDAAGPGEIVELHRPPVSVNVRVAHWAGATPTESLIEGFSEDAGMVIPISQATSWSTYEISKRAGRKKASHLKYRGYQYELGFALTYHKVQGQTMRVILDLNHTPNKRLEKAMLLVGLSRARTRQDILTLPMLTTPDHLFALQWDKKLVSWWNKHVQEE